MENPTIVFERPRVVKIDRAELPRLMRGEILVETSVSLISTGTELTILSGEFPEHSVWARYGKFPFVAGYSNVGRVSQVADDVDRGWIGTRVATRTPHGWPRRAPPPSPHLTRCATKTPPSLRSPGS